jgi:hypothetical protein
MRCKLLVIIILVLSCTFLQAQKTRLKEKQDVSLTLIPPSPVTDQIDLDIRAGISNHANKPKTFDLYFYQDRENKGNALYHKQVTLNSNSSSAVKFIWSTKNKAGEHKIILICRNGNNVFRKINTIQIISSNIRSSQQIGGAWINFYHWSDEEGRHWNADIKKMTDDQWRDLIDAQHEVKMNIIVMQELFRNQMYVDSNRIEKDGYKGLAFYPSKLFPGRMPIAAKDPVEDVLSQADKNGMKVFVAVGLYAWFDFSNGSLEWHKNVAKELWDKYGHHPSFYGWYVSEAMRTNERILSISSRTSAYSSIN